MDDSGRPDLIDDSRWNQVLAEYRRRMAAGEDVNDEQFVAEHPEMADALRSWFATSSRAGRTDGNRVDTEDDASSTSYRPLSSRDTIPPDEKTPSPSRNSGSLSGQFGRYRILRCIGQGAMGSVYLAEDSQLDREVALKIPKFTEADGPEMIARFYREARAAATLRHANVCPVHDVGEINDTHYLSMAYIEGRPLAEVIKSEPNMPERRAVEIVLKLARALAAAHTEGVIHRDLKPANIMIDEHAEPIIMDFGLARRVNRDDARLTQAGLVVGSPAYMSPEQVEGNLETMGVGCDIYSLGVIFYELLTGEIPFKGSIAAVMGQIITATPKKPSQVRASVDPRLETICLKMMAKKIADRYAKMSDVVSALENYRTTSRTALESTDLERSTTQANAWETEIGGQKPATQEGSSRFVLRPWMVWTAVLTVLAGFGVTSWILMHILQNLNSAEPGPSVALSAKQEIETRDYQLYLDDTLIPREQFDEPMELLPGEHELQVRDGTEVRKRFHYDVPEGKRYRLTLRFENNEFDVDSAEKDDLEPAENQTPEADAENSSRTTEAPESGTSDGSAIH